MELRDYALLAARNWILLVVTTLVGLVTAGALIVASTPNYESEAQVVFTAHNAGTGQDLAYAGNYVQSRIQTYKDLATSPVVLEEVIDELGLDESAAELAERTEIEVSQIDTVMRIAVRDPEAADAAEAANGVAAALLAAVTELETGPGQQPDDPRVDGLLVGPAAVQSEPAAPDRVLFVLAGLLGGLLVGFAVIATRHVLSARDDA